MKHSDTVLKEDTSDYDLKTLLHPAQAFAHPFDVVDDSDLTLAEKRAILASWASDACAVEAAPNLRRAPGSAATVSIDEVLDALRVLDLQAAGIDTAWARRQIRRGAIEIFRGTRRGAESDAIHRLTH
jgi:hypothetical protein